MKKLIAIFLLTLFINMRYIAYALPVIKQAEDGTYYVEEVEDDELPGQTTNSTPKSTTPKQNTKQNEPQYEEDIYNYDDEEDDAADLEEYQKERRKSIWKTVGIYAAVAAAVVGLIFITKSDKKD